MIEKRIGQGTGQILSEITALLIEAASRPEGVTYPDAQVLLQGLMPNTGDASGRLYKLEQRGFLYAARWPGHLVRWFRTLTAAEAYRPPEPVKAPPPMSLPRVEGKRPRGVCRAVMLALAGRPGGVDRREYAEAVHVGLDEASTRLHRAVKDGAVVARNISTFHRYRWFLTQEAADAYVPCEADIIPPRGSSKSSTKRITAQKVKPPKPPKPLFVVRKKTVDAPVKLAEPERVGPPIITAQTKFTACPSPKSYYRHQFDPDAVQGGLRSVPIGVYELPASSWVAGATS